MRASLAVTGGVHGGTDGVRAVAAGAHAVQVVSLLLQRGPGALRTLRAEMEAWMAAHDCPSLDRLRGRLGGPEDGPGERAAYMRALGQRPS